MNYEIIKNIDQLEAFVEWLPEITEEQRFYMALFARKKYVTDGSFTIDKGSLKRTVTTKLHLIDKIRQMEIPLGGYKVDGQIVPQEALAIYITPNPRSLNKAMHSLAKELIDASFSGRVLNPVSAALTAVHQSLAKNTYLDFDFDFVDMNETLEKVYEHINKSAVHPLKTRGGFHLLIEIDKVEKQFKKSWYPKITSLEGCDVKNSNLIPIPGCTQGGFTPHFIY